jgi:hypothetical protein
MSGKRHLYSDDFEACDYCRGKGTVYCSTCNGRGHREVRRQRYDAWGSTERESCTICHGSGERMCNPCGGTGDQRKYGTATDAEEDTAESHDGDDDDVAAIPIEDFAAKALEAFEQAYRQREDIIEWLWSARDFYPDYKSKFTDWLRGVSLEHPDAERLLNEAADQLNRYGVTQADILSMKISGLAAICGTAQLFSSFPQR